MTLRLCLVRCTRCAAPLLLPLVAELPVWPTDMQQPVTYPLRVFAFVRQRVLVTEVAQRARHYHIPKKCYQSPEALENAKRTFVKYFITNIKRD